MQQFEREGFAMTPSPLSLGELAEFIALIEAHASPEQKRGGIRDIMARVPKLRAVADAPALRNIVSQILGPEAVVVRSTLFDKTDGANWKVPWHQDVTIAVRERIESEGFGPWSMKEGVLHVQPPTEVLEHMVTMYTSTHVLRQTAPYASCPAPTISVASIKTMHQTTSSKPKQSVAKPQRAKPSSCGRSSFTRRPSQQILRTGEFCISTMPQPHSRMVFVSHSPNRPDFVP